MTEKNNLPFMPEEHNFSNTFKINNNSIESSNEEISPENSTLVDKPGQIYKRPREVREKISKGLKGKPKNYDSWLKGKTGPSHPSYKHGQGTLRDSVKADQAAWKLGVLKNYNYKCIVTGSTTDLAAHHLEAWCICPERRYDITNGVIIRNDIHREFHRQYTSQTTTLDFERFLIEAYGWDKPFPWRQDNHEPSLSVEELKQQQVSAKEAKKTEFLELVASRNHIFVSGEIQNAQSKVIIYCPIHNCEHTTKVTNYKKCRTGLKCCGHQKQVEAATEYERNEKGLFISRDTSTHD